MEHLKANKIFAEIRALDARTPYRVECMGRYDVRDVLIDRIVIGRRTALHLADEIEGNSAGYFCIVTEQES